MTLPNFIIAGGVATGTSFLSAALTNHPQIYLPRIQRPEPNFFHYSSKYEEGLSFYKQNWFHEVENQKVIGERSSLMLPSDLAPERLFHDIPDVKLIFCLRDPVERAWANYRFTVLEGLEPLPFLEAIELEEERMSSATGRWAEVQPHAYVSRSRYSSSLKKYLNFFSRKQILLIKSEDLGLRPKKNLDRVCDFLGVDSSVDLPLPRNYSSPNVIDNAIQSELREYFGPRFAPVIEAIRSEESLDSMVQFPDDTRNIERLKSNLQGGKEAMPDDARRRLRELLAEEILELKTIVDFPIEDWGQAT